MFILKKGHQPGVYVPLRALFLVNFCYFICLALFPVLIPRFVMPFDITKNARVIYCALLFLLKLTCKLKF